VEWAAEHPRCAWFVSMGLGKTPAALTVVHRSLNDWFDTSRWLVVAPKLVALDTWPRQLRMWQQFSHIPFEHVGFEQLQLQADTVLVNGVKKRVGLTLGSREEKRDTKARLLTMQAPVHLCSWDALPWLVKAYGSAWPYDGIVLDESLNAQNSTSDRHKAAFQVIHRLGKVSRVIELAGAPAPNGYEALHGQMRLLDGGERLGASKTAFYERFMVPAKRGPNQVVWTWKLARGGREDIDGRVGELCMSLKASDYLVLPPEVVNPILVTLPPAAREAYDTLERELVVQLGDTEILAASQGVAVSKMLQIANGFAYDSAKRAHGLHDEKLDRLVELVEASSGPVLLAYSFQADWDRIKAKFKSHAGHVKEPGALQRFRDGKTKLLCLHPASGAEGLDGLQDVSSEAVWYGATYSARHWLQFNARLTRDGQRAGRVVIHQILADDTIEGYVAGRALPAKIEEQELLLDALRWRVSGR
jgi:hypothetical protein